MDAGPSADSLCRRAQEGHTESQFLLSEKLYQDKSSRSADIAASWMWLEIAADKFYPPAQSLLGRRILEQDKPNLESALRYLTSAAGKEDKDAQYALGLMCKRGQAGLRPENALGWFQKAAAQGHEAAASAAAAEAAAVAEAPAAARLAKFTGLLHALGKFLEVPR